MPRKLSPEHQLELESLYRILSTIGEWFDGLSGMPAISLLDAMAKAYEERDLTGLRAARNDLLAMTSAASPSQRKQLDELLRQRAGTTLLALQDKQRARIARIRARGKVTSEEQYYLVREHVEFLSGDPAAAAEVGELSAMIHDFEERAAGRPGTR
jgi:hypothetical protein